MLKIKKLIRLYTESSLMTSVIVSVSLIIFAMAALQVILLKKSELSKQKAIEAQALNNKDVLLNKAGKIAKDNLALAILIANMDSVKTAISNKDRHLLLKRIKPIIDSINRDRSIGFNVHFHLPPGISFLRVWKPNKNGDDISGFRKTVTDVLTTGRPVEGIEAGRVGLAIRGVAPIFLPGKSKPAASVEVATDLSTVAQELDTKNTIFQIFGIQKVRASAAGSKIKHIGRFTVLNKAPKGVTVGEDLLEKAYKHGYAIKTMGNTLIIAARIPDYQGRPTGVFAEYIDLSAIHSQLRKEMFASVAMAVIAAIVAALFSYFGLKMNLERPLSQALDVLDKTTHGNLTRVIKPFGVTEVKTIGKMANNIIYSTGHLITLLKNQSKWLANATKEMQSCIGKVKKGSSDIDQAAQKVAEASSEASTTLQNVANATQELAEATSEIAQNVSETARATNKVQEKALFTNNVIQELGENSEKIGGIIQVINSIAEQTNLLALNATIEAARAGEAGRGFAVVANEVKELAKQTSEATEEITRMIQVIQKGTSEAVTSVQEITTSVSEVNDFTNTIASAAEEQTATVSGINTSVGKGAEKVQALERQAHKLVDQASDFAAMATALDMTENTMVTMSKQMNEVTNLYSVDMDTVKEASHYTTNAVQLTGGILAHIAWSEKLRISANEGRVPDDMEPDPRRCFLGKWLRSAMNNKSLPSDVVSEAMSIHDKLHDLAVKLKEMTESGADKKELIKFFTENLQPQSLNLFDLLKKMKKNLT